jgi:monofunctional biosynthetic peptidoglycan transglycosylase
VAAVLAACVLLYGAALGAVNLPPVRRAARDRIVSALRPRLGEVTIGPEVRFDPLFRVSFGPVVVVGARRSAPVLRLDRVRVRPSVLALLRGRIEAATVRIEGARLAIGPRGRDLRALLERGPRPARASPTAPSAPPAAVASGFPVLHVRRLTVSVPAGDRLAEIGPLDADLRGSHQGAAPELRAALRLPGNARATLEARAEGARWHVQARADGLGPEDVPAAFRDLPARLTGGRIHLEVDGDADAALDRAEARLDLAADGVFVAGERLSDAPLGPFRAAVAARVTWDGAERRLAFHDGRLSVGDGLVAALSGEARLGAGVPFSLDVRAHDVDYAAAVASLPAALRPPADAPRPRGTFDARLDAAGPLLAPATWTLSADLDLSRMRTASRGDKVALRAPFEYQPDSDVAAARPFQVGPRNPAFVPYAEVPPWVVRAVTASEDGAFFGHQGFDFAELANAFAEGAEHGHVVRGGSTITQQLAKNLFLSREKTLARKIREAAITVALEATLPKWRLLEIYLNVVEWGPGVYGVGAAARHWFAKDARDLTPKEAAFLASIIPNPIRYHAMRARGAPSDNWERRVDEILLRMAEQGALGTDELMRALAEPILFAGG